MNQLFDFSPAQVKFLGVLAATALLMSAYILVRTYAFPTPSASSFNVHIGEDQQSFAGIFVVDPNRSPADSLELLPGIGKILADRIVEYRQTRPFESEIDIINVHGIGPKLYERIRPYLKIRN